MNLLMAPKFLSSSFCLTQDKGKDLIVHYGFIMPRKSRAYNHNRKNKNLSNLCKQYENPITVAKHSNKQYLLTYYKTFTTMQKMLTK